MTYTIEKELKEVIATPLTPELAKQQIKKRQIKIAHLLHLQIIAEGGYKNVNILLESLTAEDFQRLKNHITTTEKNEGLIALLNETTPIMQQTPNSLIQLYEIVQNYREPSEKLSKTDSIILNAILGKKIQFLTTKKEKYERIANFYKDSNESGIASIDKKHRDEYEANNQLAIKYSKKITSCKIILKKVLTK